jgi:hypothetical protein
MEEIGEVQILCKIFLNRKFAKNFLSSESCARQFYFREKNFGIEKGLSFRSSMKLVCVLIMDGNFSSP